MSVLLGVLVVSPTAAAFASLGLNVQNNGVSPPPTASAAGTFDAADGYVVMFGGLGVSNTVYGTTWAFSHGNWSQLSVVGGISPPARFQAQIAYDAADGYVVLFGGCADPACHTLLDDTWTFAHDRWTDISANQTVSPPARDRGGMVDDTADGYVLLFGGEQPNRSALLNDTWTFHAGHWNPAVATPVAPSPRSGAAMVYDAALNETVLFGGNTATGVRDDTWTYRAGNWTDVSASVTAAPGARWAASATYDAEDEAPLLVNGYNDGNEVQDAWWFEGTHWVAVSDSGGPQGSYGGLLVDDPADGYVVYFSGIVSGGALYTPTFLYSSTGWTLLINPPGSSNSLLIVLLPILLVPLLFFVTVPLGNRTRRRWERQLATGVNLAPGETVRWVESPPGPRFPAQVVLLSAVLLVLPVSVLVPIAFSGVSLEGLALLAGIVALVYGGMMLLFIRSATSTNTLAIGVVSGGVIVRRKTGELRVAWENLQPSVFPPRKDRYFFQYLFPGRSQGVGGFSVSFAQARAIIMDPRAPAWVLPRAVSEALQLPARPSAAAPPPSNAPLPPGRPVPTTTPRWPQPGSPGGAPAPPLAASPGWPTRSATPPPPPTGWARPTSPPPPPPGPPPPPPGTTVCPNCGQFNPTGQVAFCRGCGRRLV